MKKIIYRKKLYYIVAIALFSLLFFRSCVFKKNNEKIANDNKTFEHKIVENQNDAELIVELANLNLTTINILNHTNINKFEGNPDKLILYKKFNYELKFDLTTIATKKLISIPNQYDIFDNSDLDTNEKNNNSFNQIKLENVIKEQMDLFSDLQNNTSDSDILEFTIRSKEKLSDIDMNI